MSFHIESSSFENEEIENRVSAPEELMRLGAGLMLNANLRIPIPDDVGLKISYVDPTGIASYVFDPLEREMRVGLPYRVDSQEIHVVEQMADLEEFGMTIYVADVGNDFSNGEFEEKYPEVFLQLDSSVTHEGVHANLHDRWKIPDSFYALSVTELLRKDEEFTYWKLDQASKLVFLSGTEGAYDYSLRCNTEVLGKVLEVLDQREERDEYLWFAYLNGVGEVLAKQVGAEVLRKELRPRHFSAITYALFRPFSALLPKGQIEEIVSVMLESGGNVRERVDEAASEFSRNYHFIEFVTETGLINLLK